MPEVEGIIRLLLTWSQRRGKPKHRQRAQQSTHTLKNPSKIVSLQNCNRSRRSTTLSLKLSFLTALLRHSSTKASLERYSIYSFKMLSRNSATRNLTARMSRQMAAANHHNSLRTSPGAARMMSSQTTPTSFSHEKMEADARYKTTVDIPEALLKTPNEESPYSIKGKFREGRAAYLDMSATTPLDPRVLDAMAPYMVRLFVDLLGRTMIFRIHELNLVSNNRFYFRLDRMVTLTVVRMPLVGKQSTRWKSLEDKWQILLGQIPKKSFLRAVLPNLTTCPSRGRLTFTRKEEST